MAELTTPDQLGDLAGLVTAVRKNKSGEGRRLTEATWGALSEILLRRVISAQSCFIRQGEHERRVYFVESGLLRVFRSEAGHRLQLGVIGAGSLVGEGAFFTPAVRHASVEAIETAVVWELTPAAFDELAERAPQHALGLALYLGAVLSARMARPAGRLSIT